MTGRKWHHVGQKIAQKIKDYLLEQGGSEDEVKNPHEVWRVKFSDSAFTYYMKGTLYSTPSNTNDPAVLEAWAHIDSSTVSGYALPTKDFLIGLDETGKGELVGHMVLTGIIFPKQIFDEIDYVVGPADTKKRHAFEYWDELFTRLDSFRDAGFDFLIEKVPPWDVDRYKLNKIMDVTYQRILSIFFRRAKIDQCRIVLDNYGIGPTLKRFLKFLEMQGAEVIVATKSEDQYLEAKTASLISKRIREAVIKAINTNKNFQINGACVGSGNAFDVRTLEWLKKWHSTQRPWPWFIKKSFKTIREIDGRPEKPKIVPPIRENLLSREFLDRFNKGTLSIESLSIICPHCGGINKALPFAIYTNQNGKKISQGKCLCCKKLIDDAGMTLRYYCGYIVPDANVIIRGLLSKDLEGPKFFENFTVILPAVVKKECDTRGGKVELERIARFASRGRIKLESVGEILNGPNDLSSIERDEIITRTALDYNAILITGDNTTKAHAMGKNLFTIFI